MLERGEQELIMGLKRRFLKASFAPLWDDGIYGGLLLLLEDVSFLRQPQET